METDSEEDHKETESKKPITVVLPGDKVTKYIQSFSSDKSKIILGPGLKREGDDIVAIKCGILRTKNDNMIWIDTHQKRYVAVKGERVIGIVTNKLPGQAKLDIGTNETALLSLLAFENVSKRTRPNIEIGDIVYAQVLSASKDMEAELVCVNSKGKRDGLGILAKSGYLCSLSLNVARQLLSPDCLLLEELGKKFRHEIVVGLNGRVWINATTIANVLKIYDSISHLEHTPFEQVLQNVKNEFETVSNKKAKRQKKLA